MGKNKSLRARFLAFANKHASESHDNKALEDRRNSNNQAIEMSAEHSRQIRLSLSGDGDGSFERELLEMRRLTGYSFDELNGLDAHEFDKIALAAIRMEGRIASPAQSELEPDDEIIRHRKEIAERLSLTENAVILDGIAYRVSANLLDFIREMVRVSPTPVRQSDYGARPDREAIDRKLRMILHKNNAGWSIKFK